MPPGKPEGLGIVGTGKYGTILARITPEVKRFQTIKRRFTRGFWGLGTTDNQRHQCPCHVQGKALWTRSYKKRLNT